MKGSGVILFFLVLAVFHCIGSVSEQEEVEFTPVAMTQDLPLSPFVYSISSGATSSVCPVLMMGTSQVDAVLQPSPTALGGEFLFSKRSVFNLSHIVRPCVNGSVLSPTDMCDQLLMTTLGDITESGCFTIQYRPAGRSPLIQTQVIYGPPGLHYTGPSASSTEVPVEVTMKDGLNFELRVLVLGTPTVCDSIGQDPFEVSTILEARTPTRDSNCLQAFGSFSQPYTISVRFREGSSQLTERRIKVILVGDCSTYEIGSAELLVGPEVTEPTKEPTTATIFSSSTTPSGTTDNIAAIAGSTVAAAAVLLLVILVILVVLLRKCRKNNSSASQVHKNGFSNGTSNSVSQRSQLNEENNFTDSPDTIGTIFFNEDNTWRTDFERSLADKHITVLLRLDDSSPKSIKEELSKSSLKWLYIAADDPSQVPTGLLSELKSSQEFRSKVVMVINEENRGEVKREDWGKGVSYRHKSDTGTECAERVFSDVDGGQVGNGSVTSLTGKHGGRNKKLSKSAPSKRRNEPPKLLSYKCDSVPVTLEHISSQISDLNSDLSAKLNTLQDTVQDTHFSVEVMREHHDAGQISPNSQ